MRYSTQKQDQQIIELYVQGVPPKEIVVKLNLTNVWAVYHAKKRNREMFRVEQNCQNLPKAPTEKFQNS